MRMHIEKWGMKRVKWRRGINKAGRESKEETRALQSGIRVGLGGRNTRSNYPCVGPALFNVIISQGGTT